MTRKSLNNILDRIRRTLLDQSYQDPNIRMENIYWPSSIRAPEGSTLFAVVLNERTGGLGAVLGTIQVILASPGSAQALALDFGLTVKKDYPHLKAAFLQVPEGGDPFAVAEALGKDPRVASAKAEVLENPPVPQ